MPQAIGWLVLAAAIAGLWLLRNERSWRETLLLSWIAVPVVFFQIWPVKGFQYLLPAAPAVALLAARTLSRWRSPGAERTLLARSCSAAGSCRRRPASIALSRSCRASGRIQPSASGNFLAGSGGVPGGREAGRWIEENVPEGASFMTIGPSMANIVQFYGHRKAYGLSVSPNPLHRNPSYEPLINPDRVLRDNELHYLVWDSFSAARSPFFARRLKRYADRYNGRVVHTETALACTAGARRSRSR